MLLRLYTYVCRQLIRLAKILVTNHPLLACAAIPKPKTAKPEVHHRLNQNKQMGSPSSAAKGNPTKEELNLKSPNNLSEDYLDSSGSASGGGGGGNRIEAVEGLGPGILDSGALDAGSIHGLGDHYPGLGGGGPGDQHSGYGMFNLFGGSGSSALFGKFCCCCLISKLVAVLQLLVLLVNYVSF